LKYFVALFGGCSLRRLSRTLAAQAIKGAIARHASSSPDAAAVQFTRNADAIAGALDTAARAPFEHHGRRRLRQAFSAHVFWPGGRELVEVPGIRRSRSAPRVHPGFQRADYRAGRHACSTRSRVLDDAGNVVRTIS